jgi:hypothetical protein
VSELLFDQVHVVQRTLGEVKPERVQSAHADGDGHAHQSHGQPAA